MRAAQSIPLNIARFGVAYEADIDYDCAHRCAEHEPDSETEEKVRNYLLNPVHPVGGPKAAWFAKLGYTIDNWQDLVDDLLQLARTVDGLVAKPSPFGVKYEVSGEIGRPGHRPADVLTIWIVEENSVPQLITAYPG